MKRGLELEYWVIDETGRLTAPSRALAELSFVEREAHPCLIEIKTEPFESIPDLCAQLRDRLDQTLEIAHANDRRLAPVGTALDGVDADDCRQSRRIDAQRRLLGEWFRHALACAGTHVHFEQREPAAQLNALTALDPAFALVNTTPYSDGQRVCTCARPTVYRRQCYEEYPTLGQLWPYAESVAEWRQRLQNSYEQFTRAATIAGVSERILEEAFTDATAVCGPVRLRDDLSTVEWRAPDACLPSQALQLVTDVSRIVERATSLTTNPPNAASGLPNRSGTAGDAPDLPGAGGIDLPPFDELQQLTDTAITRGVTDRSVRRYLSRLGLDPDEYEPLGREIDGSRRISADRAREIRRRFAARLEADVETLRADSFRHDELDLDVESSEGRRTETEESPTVVRA